MDVEKKIFSFYFKNAEQKLAIYAGTPQSEIINSIKEVLHLQNATTIRFLDEDGIPVVISSYLPNNIKIFVQDSDEVVSKINQINQSASNKEQIVEWSWIPNDSQIKISDKKFQTQDMSTTKAYGSIKYEKGVHYWRVRVGTLYCCQDFGICKGEIHNFVQGGYQQENQDSIKGLPDRIPGTNSGPGSTGCSELKINDCIFGFYVDMDSKKFMIINETYTKVYRKTKFSFNQAIPFVYSCKHTNTFELIESKATPSQWVIQESNKPDFEEAIIVYKKE